MAEEPKGPSLYEILGVTDTATAAELKAAHRSLSLKFHPDKNPGNDEARKQFEDVQDAYKTLSDPVARRAYDRGNSAILPETDLSEAGLGTRVLLGVIGGLGVRIPTKIPQKVVDSVGGGDARAKARRMTIGAQVTQSLSRNEAGYMLLTVPSKSEVCIVAATTGRHRYKLVMFSTDGEAIVTAEPVYDGKSKNRASLLFSDVPDRLQVAVEDSLTEKVRPGGVDVPRYLTALDLYTPAYSHALEPGEYLFAVINENMFSKLEVNISVHGCDPAYGVTVSDVERALLTKRTELEELRAQYIALQQRLMPQEKALSELLDQRERAYNSYQRGMAGAP